MSWEIAQDEQVVLASLLAWPQANGWELSGLDPRCFSVVSHRKIAEALCAVRDSGRRVHWRRVRVELKKRGASGLAGEVPRLVRAVGTSIGLTAAMSRLHHYAARRVA